jgi:hypothetical protein
MEPTNSESSSEMADFLGDMVDFVTKKKTNNNRRTVNHKKSKKGSNSTNATVATAMLAAMGLEAGIGEANQTLLSAILSMANATVFNCIPNACEIGLMNMTASMNKFSKAYASGSLLANFPEVNEAVQDLTVLNSFAE